jgi:hypothetical protein
MKYLFLFCFIAIILSVSTQQDDTMPGSPPLLKKPVEEAPPTAEEEASPAAEEEAPPADTNPEEESAPSNCVTGGCSGELCQDENSPTDVVSACLYDPRFDCYKTASKCERQEDGACGWTQTDELKQCINSVDLGCRVGYCAQDCMEAKDFDPTVAVTCVADPFVDCYSTATCERQVDGKCGWSGTPDLNSCLNRCVQGYCGACIRQKDLDVNLQIFCPYNPLAYCYYTATCEIQPEGHCGYTDTQQLNDCLNTVDVGCTVGYCGNCMEVNDYNPNFEVADCFQDPYADCYTKAVCERQPDQTCGFTPTPEVDTCLNKDLGCMVGYCSNCMEVKNFNPQLMVSCFADPTIQCYQSATCERQTDGGCGYTETSEIQNCVDSVDLGCKVNSCEGTCIEVRTMGPRKSAPTCRSPFTECYNNAGCARQGDGKCGWSEQSKLDECIKANQPHEEEAALAEEEAEQGPSTEEEAEQEAAPTTEEEAGNQEAAPASEEEVAP